MAENNDKKRENQAEIRLGCPYAENCPHHRKPSDVLKESLVAEK